MYLVDKRKLTTYIAVSMYPSENRSALFVDGLSLSVTAEDLNECFSPFGTVIWTRVATDRFRKSLGFGYVIMDAEGADRAIQTLNGKTIAGGVLTIVRTEIPPLPRTA
jgi:RNA recognition motif-containing protein